MSPNDRRPTAAITRGQLANLVYDALQADMNVQVGFGGDRIYRREKGHTMLTEYQKLRRAYGTVSGTLYTGLAAPGEKGRGRTYPDRRPGVYSGRGN